MTVQPKKRVARTAPKPKAARTTKATGKYVQKIDLNNPPPGMSSKLTQRVRDIGLTTDPKLQPGGGATHCNQAADKYARGFGYKGLEDKNGNPMMANDMFKKMNAPGSGWKKLTAQEAIDAAKNGKMVFAAVQGNPHGHIAAVTGEWSPGVPGVSQAGSPPNFEFGKWRRKETPTYFVQA
jgi:hypothetical protein